MRSGAFRWDPAGGGPRRGRHRPVSGDAGTGAGPLPAGAIPEDGPSGDPIPGGIRWGHLHGRDGTHLPGGLPGHLAQLSGSLEAGWAAILYGGPGRGT